MAWAASSLEEAGRCSLALVSAFRLILPGRAGVGAIIGGAFVGHGLGVHVHNALTEVVNG